MATSSNFEETLRGDFLKVEDELLDVVLAGSESSTLQFIDRLSSLTQSVAHGIANHLLSDRTLSLVRRVASNAKILTTNLRELEPRTRSIEDKRQDDLSDLFARFSLNDKGTSDSRLHTERKRSVQQRRCPSTSDVCYLPRSLSEETLVPSDSEPDELLPPHVLHCYRWLTENLHNPYPSRREKVDIAEASGTVLKKIESWFVNVRRRIGWTALYDSHYHSAKALMVDAAYRVFELGDRGDSVSPSIAQQFLRIRSKLKELYEDKVEPSTYTRKLEEVVEEQRKYMGNAQTRKRKRTILPCESRTFNRVLRYVNFNPDVRITSRSNSIESGTGVCSPGGCSGFSGEERSKQHM